MTKTSRFLVHGAALLALAGAGVSVAAAQDRPPADQADQLLNSVAVVPAPAAKPVPVVNDGEAYHRAEDSRQDPEELRTTQALNDEITSRNQLAENQERADQAAFEAERARYEEAVARSTEAQLVYEQQARQSEAARRQWEADRARWEADVRACEAGNRARCGLGPN